MESIVGPPEIQPAVKSTNSDMKKITLLALAIGGLALAGCERQGGTDSYGTGTTGTGRSITNNIERNSPPSILSTNDPLLTPAPLPQP